MEKLVALVVNLLLRWSEAKLLRHLRTCSNVPSCVLGREVQLVLHLHSVAPGGLFKDHPESIVLYTFQFAGEGCPTPLCQTTEQYSRLGRTKDR